MQLLYNQDIHIMVLHTLGAEEGYYLEIKKPGQFDGNNEGSLKWKTLRETSPGHFNVKT